MAYPNMYRLRQVFDAPNLTDIEAVVTAEILNLNIGTRIKPGDRIGITAGSRGIAHIDRVKLEISFFQ